MTNPPAQDGMEPDENARRMAAEARAYLRSQVLLVNSEVGSLISREERLRIADASATVSALVRGLADALEGQDGTATPESIAVFDSLADLARRRMIATEKEMPVETPSGILRWFALYLERILSTHDLRMA